MRKNLLLFALIFVCFVSFAQAPAGYYNNAMGKYGVQLQQALHDIIKNHEVQSYQSLWTHFRTTDKKPNGKVWDMYSDRPSGTPQYEYTFGNDQCGSYHNEGDCYNREHSFPKSWFNEGYPMYTDLFHLYPTDGYVNGRRSNYPYGEVSSATWISTNGSKVGNSCVNGYNGTVFEPIDEYKGDLARTYFYMATRYYNEDANWSGSPMVNGSQLEPWALQMMRDWAKDDPVSQKEIDRNNAVYAIQGNRNPFIDHPEFVEMIWREDLGVEKYSARINSLTAYPNPTCDIVNIHLPFDINEDNYEIYLFSVDGKRMSFNVEFELSKGSINLNSIPEGVYLLQLVDKVKGSIYQTKIIRASSL